MTSDFTESHSWDSTYFLDINPVCSLSIVLVVGRVDLHMQNIASAL